MTEVHNLQSLLRSLADNTQGETVTVRDLLDAVGRRSYGPVLLLLGFVAASPLTLVPGANWFVALLILLFAGQIAIGLEYPWLPRRALDATFKRKHLLAGIRHAEKHAHTVDRLVRPRLVFLTEPPFAQLVALICVGAALITFPLGSFPLGPLLPSLTVLLFGLGLAARDGLVLALATATLIGAIIVLIRVLPRIVGWFS
jgi:hypothetical protein